MCLILMTALLSGITFAEKDETESQTASGRKESSTSITIRAIYKASSDALGEGNYYIYASCIAFPITAEGNTVYLIADAAMYDFNTIAAAAAKKIKPFFENSSIHGLKPSEYANEFRVLGANIEVVIGEKSYSPRLLYTSDTYAILVISDVPQLEILPYTEDDFEGTVRYQEYVDDSFGMDTSEPQFETAVLDQYTSLTCSEEQLELAKEVTANSVGSPVVTTDGIICGFISCDSETGQAHVVKLSGLASKFKQLGIELKAIKIIKENPESPGQESDGSKTETAASDEETAGNQKLVQTSTFRKVVIWVTCFAGLLFVIVVILMILRTRNTNKRAKAKAKRSRMRGMNQGYAKPSAVSAPTHSEGNMSAKKQYDANAAENAEQSETRNAERAMPIERKTYAPSRAAAQVKTEKAVSANELPRYMMLAVLEGPMKGFSINISDSILIGRDAKCCQVAFPASQTDISRKHCQLTYRPEYGDLILEDLNSVNGTFTPDGRRYAAGRRYLLRSGDRFCIGSRENLIEVR